MHLGFLLFALLAAVFAAIFVWQFMKPRRAVTAFDTVIYEEETKPRAWYVELVRLRAGWGVICWTVIAIASLVASFAIPQMEQARENRLDAIPIAWDRCTAARDLLGDASMEAADIEAHLDGTGFTVSADTTTIGQSSYRYFRVYDTGQDYLEALDVDRLQLGTLFERAGGGVRLECNPIFADR